MGIISVILNNINVDDTNYDENAPDAMTSVMMLVWNNKLEKLKAFKKPLNQ